MGPKKGGKKEKKGKSDAGVKVIPPGYGPMVVTGHTKQLLGCEVGEGVTEEKPAMFVKREIMIEDIVNRAAVSDFAVFKKFIQAYPEEDMLLVFDLSFKYDASYFLCLTIEAKDTILKELEPEEKFEDEIKEGELSEEVSLEEKGKIEEVEVEEEEEIEMILPEYTPLESKPWISLGSEIEVEGEQVIDSRPKIKIVVSERDLLARKELELSDRSPSQYKELYLEIPPSEEVLQGIYRKTVNQGIQAVVLQKMSDSQTLTVKPINAWTQYEPRTYSEEEKIDILESEKLSEFAQKVEKRVSKALQQNIIADVFKDDWAALGDEECEFSAEQDNSLKEYQSFTYLQHKNMKMITSVNWHPDLKGVLASSCVESCSFEESADNLSNLLLEPCLVFVWSFVDPILPQLLLEAPEEVNTIQFNPTVPYLLAGGCTNGQLVLWDLKQYEDKLQTPSEQSWIKKSSAFTLAALGDMQGGIKSSVLRYCTSSNIDSSHMHGIYHIEWIPSHMMVGQKGEIELSTSPYCFQIVTCGLDGIWDIRGKPPEGSEDNKLPKHVGHKSPYAALDMAWKPFHTVNIPRLESHVGVDLTCFALKVGKAKKANDTYLVAKDVTEEKDGNNSEEKDSKPLISSVFFGGTETGKVIHGDWKFIKDETGNFFPPPPEYYTSIFDVTIHGGPIVSIEQSPFLNDVFFSIGGRSMGIWKEDLKKGPLLLKLCTSCAITTGNWSSTRPAVFYLGCEDGTLRLWDLVVTSHNAIMIQSVSSTHITSITTRQMSENEQVLAVGDRLGTIHIIALPNSLWEPVEDELEILKKFIERESKRTDAQAKRRAKEQELKAEEKQRKADEEEAKKKVKPKSEEVIAEDNRTDEEKERDFCQAENKKNLALEKKVLLKLGFIEPEETEAAAEEENESSS